MTKRLARKMKLELAKSVEKISRKNNVIQPVEVLPDLLAPERISAHDLFLIFTANIIQKKTTFTR